jgi:hypothetical protein
MRKFHVVDGGAEPVSPAAKVRKRLRESRVKALPQCAACGGRETIDTRIGAVKQRLCVCCLLQGRRVVVT